MNILVISDLHLGVNGKADIFHWNDEGFINILEDVQEHSNVEKIILNGDVYELYKHRREDIEKKHSKLLKYLRDKEAVFIKGNHDAIVEDSQINWTHVNSKGCRIHVEHGHNADFFNGTKFGRAIGHFLMVLLKLMCRIDFVNRIYLHIVKLDDEISRIPRRYNSYKYLNYALKLLKKNDVVILGHTHKMEIHKTWHFNSKKRYLNCGSCSMGRFHGIVLNTETLRYETVKIEKPVVCLEHAVENVKLEPELIGDYVEAAE